jgi:hypothetical protein
MTKGDFQAGATPYFRRRMMPWRFVAILAVALVVTPHAMRAQNPPAKPADDAAVERARRQVRMLDDLYKTAVVLITETYVKSETDVSAATAAIAIFEAMNKKNWHQARLLDATGNPYDDKNVAQDDFDKHAIGVLKEGKQAYVERIETKDGDRYLRAATPVPVVSKKCVMCHPHYADAKPGQAIGAISYRLKIE